MKKIIIIILISSFSLFLNGTINAQSGPPPPPPSGGESNSSNVPAGRAPIGGGLFILLGLGAAYGAKKVYDLKKKSLLD